MASMHLSMTSAAKCRDVLEGLPVVLRYIARAGGRSFLYGTDALTACQVHALSWPRNTHKQRVIGRSGSMQLTRWKGHQIK